MKPDSFRDFVLEQLHSVRPLTCRAMFGGHGLSSAARFFGIVHKGRLFFKVNDATRADYETAGMTVFRPGAKQVLNSFFEVPIEVLESTPQLEEWARRAIRAANERTHITKHRPSTAANAVTIRARVWVYKGPSGWHFVTVPVKQSAQIKKAAGFAQKAWGSLSVLAHIGESEWKTSLFFDGKRNAYLLPIKADIRKKEQLEKNTNVTVHLKLRCD